MQSLGNVQSSDAVVYGDRDLILSAEKDIREISAQMLVTDHSSYPRLRREVRSGRYLQIRSGFYLDRQCLEGEASEWMVHRRIAIARHIAHYPTHRHIEAFTHQSALLLRGLPVLRRPGGIHERRQRQQGRSASEYPAVRMGRQTLSPPGRVVVHSGEAVGDEFETIGGLPVTTLRETARDILIFSPPAVAVAEVSMLLRSVAGYSRWQRQDSESRASSFRALVERTIDEAESVKSKRRALELLSMCDPACESIAEAYFAWFLHAFNAHPWKTQVEILADGSLFVADFCFPDQKVLVEIEGFTKLGAERKEIGRNLDALMQRSNLLSAQGWNVIHVPAQQIFVDPIALYTHLRQVAAGIFAMRPPQKWLLRT